MKKICSNASCCLNSECRHEKPHEDGVGCDVSYCITSKVVRVCENAKYCPECEEYHEDDGMENSVCPDCGTDLVNGKEGEE